MDCNNKYIIDNIPNNIEELYLNVSFNLKLDNLPSSIKIIKFNANSKYNKKLNNLPKLLEYLHIPKSLEDNIENLNPNCTIIFVY